MKALRVLQENQEATLTDITEKDLTPGDVHIKIEYSSLNYKDALAVTSKGRILKKYPLNPGIDLAGEVISAANSPLKPGQKVLVTGCGTGEEKDGGYGEQVKINAQDVIALPEGMTTKNAMSFGTAGFTAALAVHRLLQNDQTPEKGPILVTGATGGVGGFALAILSHLGFETIALTGKKSTHEKYLKGIGATQVKTIEELQLGSKPLEKALFGGAIDNLGGKTLSQILPHIQLWGNVCSIGLASGYELSATVMPFILRGVSLLGISSNNCPLPLRQEIWKKLSKEWKTEHFEKIPVEEIGLQDILPQARKMLERKTSGRIVVKIAPSK